MARILRDDGEGLGPCMKNVDGSGFASPGDDCVDDDDPLQMTPQIQ